MRAAHGTSIVATLLLLCASLGQGAETKALRVLSMTPNVTEIILALGAGDTLVGVSDYCQPPAELNLPRCGGVINPNFEHILAVRPTVIFLLGKMEKVQRFADEHSFRTISGELSGSADLMREVEVVGNEVGRQKEAAAFCESFRAKMAEIQKRGEGLPRYRSLIVFGRDKGSLRRISSVGQLSFLSEMLELAHGENIFSDQKQMLFRASHESIIALQPEVVFELRAKDSIQDDAGIQADWNADASLPAVQRGRVIVAKGDFLTIPGPRMLQIAEVFQKHFEKFAEEDRLRK